MGKLFTRETLLTGAFMDTITRLYCCCKAKCRLDSGQGVAEYIIILAVIVIACIILAVAFHEQLTSVWNSVTDQLGGIA